MLWATGTSGGCKRAGGLPNAACWEPVPREGAGRGADGAEAGSRGWGGSEMPGCSISGRDKDAECLVDNAGPSLLTVVLTWLVPCAPPHPSNVPAMHPTL